MQLQTRFGAAGVIKGVGSGALAVADMLKRMRTELGGDAPPVGEPFPHARCAISQSGRSKAMQCEKIFTIEVEYAGVLTDTCWHLNICMVHIACDGLPVNLWFGCMAHDKHIE